MPYAGHGSIKSEKVKERSAGTFLAVLSYDILSQRRAAFVIHVWSNTFNLGPTLQRGSPNYSGRESFLERMGFEHFSPCPFIPGEECFFHVIGEKERELGSFSNKSYHRAFDRLIENLEAIYTKMEDLDKILLDTGVRLPYSGLQASILQESVREKLYEPGAQYDVYKDLKRILQGASKEVFIVDAWPDESILELYVDSVENQVNVKILTKNPGAKFVTVARMAAAKRPLEVVDSPMVHDRYIFVDNKCWMLGASIKDAAREKPTVLVELDARDALYGLWITYFQNGKKLV